MICRRNSYHGGSSSMMAATSHHTWKFPQQLNSGFHHAVCPDPYRSPFSGTPEEIATKSANEVREIIRYSTPGGIAAFMAEPIQGVGGATQGAANYLREAYAHAGAVSNTCIADEVQTGFGRTGEHYWGFRTGGQGLDIRHHGQGIGNGAPLAPRRHDPARDRREADAAHPLQHLRATPSPWPASATPQVIDDEGIQGKAKSIGGRLEGGLEDLQRRHRRIGDVRGRGLMLGVELVKDRGTRRPPRRRRWPSRSTCASSAS
ncbi:MAG: aminotransferase class III-fold pyridoxal phosphate-dependent enzyme [Gemmatimonadetes bacterium]|nr:aminotransferase class III-fold pyridoxal phosphate-dependent enzyme [Gemmatimonadota bacterium]